MEGGSAAYITSGIRIFYTRTGDFQSTGQALSAHRYIHTINSDQPRKTQDIVIFHEVGHYALNHHKRKQVCAFHDYGIFDNSSELEDEANRFVAEYLLEDDKTLTALREHRDFFTAASCLHVPKEILDYKMRMLRYATDERVPNLHTAGLYGKD